jgi:hypothetical protein
MTTESNVKLSISKHVPQFVQKLILSGRGYMNKGTRTWQALKEQDFFGDKKWTVVDQSGAEFSMYLCKLNRVTILKNEFS